MSKDNCHVGEITVITLLSALTYCQTVEPPGRWGNVHRQQSCRGNNCSYLIICLKLLPDCRATREVG